MHLLDINISLVQILIPAFAALLGVWLNHIFTKNRVKAETENFVVTTMRTAMEEMRLEREDDRMQIKLNQELIKTLTQDHDDCEFEHSITRLQLNKALKRLDMLHWVRSTVYVLDDNELVKRVFIHRFRTIPVVNFKAFTDMEECLEMAKEERPEIMVIDYMLSEGHTAEEIIAKLGYTPEIFIMSGTKDYEQKFKDTDIKFFYKDTYYVRNITKAILEHLISRNH